MYGYEIREMVKQRFNFEPAIVTAYVVLYKMTKEGLVGFKIEKNPNGKPDRKYYHITPKGNQTLEKARLLVDDIYQRVFDRSPSAP